MQNIHISLIRFIINFKTFTKKIKKIFFLLWKKLSTAMNADRVMRINTNTTVNNKACIFRCFEIENPI